jgi:hypothetical protein
MVIGGLDGAFVNILPGEVFEHPGHVFNDERIAGNAVGGIELKEPKKTKGVSIEWNFNSYSS